jgi:glycosyltransferase involved in cell wall biosynthesis
MDNEILDNTQILFFGSGKIGRFWLDYAVSFGIIPKGFIDNNRDICGSLCNNITIYSPDDLESLDFEKIFITCAKEQEVYQQLIVLGIPENKIVTGYHNILNHLLYYAAINIKAVESVGDFDDKSIQKKVVFDLYNGMVLGGVEAWSYDLAKKLRKQRYQGLYLTTDTAVPVVIDDTYPIEILTYTNYKEEKDKIEIGVKKIIENLPCTIICNFPQHIFWSACIAKQLYPKQVKIISVIHNDDKPYYDVYSLWQEFIDRCMVISLRMEQKLLLSGMKQGKLKNLEWQISCKEYLEKIWGISSASLQIGYAGRVTITQKRADLFWELAKKLKEKAINFQLNIAGTGDYSEILQQKVCEENFQEYIIPVGYIDRKSLPDFWSRQDIMINCSEWEGHSISQSEAMAEGAVPVITDVSGARDDVTDGYNGYIVDIGDIDAMADRICELYHNRDKLKQMGIRAHSTIYERQKNIDQAEFWDDLIKKVWQE